MIRPIFLALAISGSAILFAQNDKPDVTKAGNDQVAEIIKTYKGRGTLADDTPITPPKDAVKDFRMREGFEMELIASEPEIGQPLHISWDSKGRMWVTQYLQYQFPAGLKIVEYDNHLRAQFDKVPQPPPHGTKGADKITVFEDTNGDGKYDSHRDVITGLNIATSAVHGAGGIWVSNPPYLLFYPDADNDATPDGNGDPEVMLSGFGIEDTHAVMNSLKWGPDGWLYGANGSTTTGEVKDPASGEIVKWQGQMIWRYHPPTKRFEIYAEGGGNTFSVEIDSKGRVFSGTNNGSTRGMYYPQGAYGKKGWGKHGPLTNPYAFGYIDHMVHEGDNRRFAQAFCIYEGGLYGPEWEGKIIAPNSLHNVVWVSELLPDGSTFKTVDEEPLAETDDRWFRPVFSGVGPDGCVYVADWSDTRLSHVRPIDDWDKKSGRIYRIKPAGTDPKIPTGDLFGADTKTLLSKVDDSNWTVAKRAILEIGWADPTTIDYELLKLSVPQDQSEIASRREPGFNAVAAFQAALEKRELKEATALNKIRHYNEMIGASGLRLPDKAYRDGAMSRGRLGVMMWEDLLGHLYSEFQSLIPEEPDLITRARMAEAAKRAHGELGITLAFEICEIDKDSDDPHIPLLTWWALEEHAEDCFWLIETYAADPETWKSKIFREFIAERLIRRYAMAGGEANFATAAKLLETAPDDDAKKRLMTGLQLAFQGAPIPKLPDALTKQMDEYSKNAGENDLVLAIQRGDKDALKKALGVVASNASDPVERIELAKAFGEAADKSVVPTLLKLLSLDQQSALKRVALQSLANFDDASIPKTILGRLGSTLPQEHGVASTAHRVVAGRPEWAREFLRYIDRAIVKARHVEPDVVQLLALHKDPEINSAIAKHWPDMRAKTSEDNQKEITRIQKILGGGEGDPAAGKTHFTTRCAACHKLFDEGNTVAPDLTGYERQSLDFWLPGIIDPSLEIREGFTNFIATMNDGRIVMGMIASESPQTVTLRDAANQETLLNRADMKSLVASPVSLMPPGLLGGMTEDELRDFFAYLQK